MIRALLLILATARATRFITEDWLGHWWIVRPARRWALESYPHLTVGWTDGAGNPVNPDPDVLWHSIEEGMPDLPARLKLVKGLDCPYCVGFWIGAIALLGEVTIARVPVLGAVWRYGIATFALNYVVGHAVAKFDR